MFTLEQARLTQPFLSNKWVVHAQGLLSGVLQVIIQKLSEQDVTKAGVTAFADTIMEALLSVFACHSSTVHEEAMLAVGALTYACGTQFNKYMERFYPYLELGLKNYQVGYDTIHSFFVSLLTHFLHFIFR